MFSHFHFSSLSKEHFGGYVEKIGKRNYRIKKSTTFYYKILKYKDLYI